MLRCCCTWVWGKGLRLVRGRPGEEGGRCVLAATIAVAAAAEIAAVAGVVRMWRLLVAVK